MPIYEYRCDDCGTKFERLVRRAEEIQAMECPSCGQRHLKQELSTFSAHMASPSKGGPAPCGAGMCPTPGMCGRN
jgi:putative FmdB family regulatory protein